MRLYNKFGEYTSLGQTIQEDSSADINKLIRKIHKKYPTADFSDLEKLLKEQISFIMLFPDLQILKKKNKK